MPQYHKKLNSPSVDNTYTGTGDQSNDAADIFTFLSKTRVKNYNRIIVSHININSLRNKFEILSAIVSDKLDLLLVSETKLDSSFLSTSFLLPGFSKPLRRDRTAFGGGIMLFIRENITFKKLSDIPVPENIECIRLFL